MHIAGSSLGLAVSRPLVKGNEDAGYEGEASFARQRTNFRTE